MGWPTRRPLWCLLWWGFAAQGLKRTFCTFSLFYRGCRVGCSPFFGSQLTLPYYCPQCLWISRPKVGLNPSLMLKFCQFAMSLHLPSKTLMLLSLPNPWKACWRWFQEEQKFLSGYSGLWDALPATTLWASQLIISQDVSFTCLK